MSKITFNRRIKRKQPKAPTYRYRVVVSNRGNRVKIHLETKDRLKALLLYDKLMVASSKVIFPIKYSVLEKLVRAEYELMFMREVSNPDEIEPERLFEGKWKIIKREPYNVEETFSLFGKSNKHDRMTVVDLKNYLTKRTKNNREYGILQNKIVIFDDECFDMIITKCPDDGRRLGKFLYKYIDNSKLLFYRGEYYGGDKPEIVDVIQHFTGWSRPKIHQNKKNKI